VAPAASGLDPFESRKGDQAVESFAGDGVGKIVGYGEDRPVHSMRSDCTMSGMDLCSDCGRTR
jgi:hypothetical protein